ncbi:S41 family peptidase [Erythrobacter sp. HKB08]|uniref:S41 family peptidase n=1 Tax=Erythrobacter sp. HKB08 TaxID=2502843 RepID=UPI001008F8CB|nr:S41 family peptidase [Erythrobacter sp. HKB08]
MRFIALSLTCLVTSLAAPLSAAPSEEAAAYFDHAAKLLKERHYKTETVDWSQLEPRARGLIEDAETTGDTYLAIRLLIDELGEKHSFLITPQVLEQDRRENGPDAPEPKAPPLPEGRMAHEGVGYVSIPQLNMLRGGQELASQYSLALQQALSRLDSEATCGWVVDLRGNTGGNMWPMLWGLDPLLGEGAFGYFVTKTGLVPWTRTEEGIMGAREVDPAIGPAFRLANEDAPVAVLLDRRTISAGEMVALALIGREGVRSFGQPSGGFSTANMTFPLSDGARLVVTVANAADRLERVADGPIVPDIETPAADAEQAAINWLSANCSSA